MRSTAVRISPDSASECHRIPRPNVTGFRVRMSSDSASECHRIPQLLKLGDQYTPQRLENACIKALDYSPNPSYKTIQLILKSGQDKIGLETSPPEPSPHGFTRGAGYYAKGAK